MFPIEVVIPTYNDENRLALALWGYTQQTFKDFVIHIVNDGGEDVQGLLEKFPLNFQYHFLHPKTDTYRPSEARNTALAKIQSERVICTDTDIIPCSDLVEEHMRFGADNLIVVGRRQAIAEEQIPELLAKLESNTLQHSDLKVIDDDYRFINNRPWMSFAGCSWDTNFQDMSCPIAWDCWSCNISYPSIEVKDIGGFCTSYDGIWGGEDTDLAIRMIKNGSEVASLLDVTGYHLNHPTRADIEWESMHDRLNQEWDYDGVRRREL